MKPKQSLADEAMKAKKSLAQVDPEGRVDVLVYTFMSRLIEKLEREEGVRGLSENLLPIVEQMTRAYFPCHNVIPPELGAVLKVVQANRRAR